MSRSLRRCLSALGFDEYQEGHTDGLQVLRYNTTTAYTHHLDYMEPRRKERHDYASERKGGNRYATVLLYMSNLEEGEGGETVFTNAWPPEQSEEEHVPIDQVRLLLNFCSEVSRGHPDSKLHCTVMQAIEALRASGDAATLKEGSWEEKMAAECRTRLAVRGRG